MFDTDPGYEEIRQEAIRQAKERGDTAKTKPLRHAYLAGIPEDLRGADLTQWSAPCTTSPDDAGKQSWAPRPSWFRELSRSPAS